MANFNLNKVILGGRLTADPELKTTPSGISVCSFCVAVNRDYKGPDGKYQADFINVTAWRGTAEFVSRYFRKASSICVIGSIQTRTWVDQAGQKRFGVDIVAEEARFVDALKDAPEALRLEQPEIALRASSKHDCVGAEEDVGDEIPGDGQKAKAPPRAFSTPGARKEFDKLDDEEDLPF